MKTVIVNVMKFENYDAAKKYFTEEFKPEEFSFPKLEAMTEALEETFKDNDNIPEEDKPFWDELCAKCQELLDNHDFHENGNETEDDEDDDVLGKALASMALAEFIGKIISGAREEECKCIFCRLKRAGADVEDARENGFTAESLAKISEVEGVKNDKFLNRWIMVEQQRIKFDLKEEDDIKNIRALYPTLDFITDAKDHLELPCDYHKEALETSMESFRADERAEDICLNYGITGKFIENIIKKDDPSFEFASVMPEFPEIFATGMSAAKELFSQMTSIRLEGFYEALEETGALPYAQFLADVINEELVQEWRAK